MKNLFSSRFFVPSLFIFAIIALVGPSLKTVQALTKKTSPVQVIVNRDGGDVEVFIAMSAHLIEPLLGKDSNILFNDEGRLPIDEIRTSGSFQLADRIFDRVMWAGGKDGAEFQAMSLMAHPKSYDPPFKTPLDATMAISICTNDYTAEELVPENVQVIYGGFGGDWGEATNVNLSFPKTGREVLDVELRSYANGTFLKAENLSLPDGGTLQVDAKAAQTASSFGLVVVALFGGLASLGAFALRRRLSNR
ncbi:MAG: hypothetical protein AAF903_05395 [Pseudomonadota bacterium]